MLSRWWNAETWVWLLSAAGAFAVVAAAVVTPVLRSPSGPALPEAIPVSLEPPTSAPVAGAPVAVWPATGGPTGDRAALAVALGILMTAQHSRATDPAFERAVAPANLAAYRRAMDDAELIADPVRRLIALARARQLLDRPAVDAPSGMERQVDGLLGISASATP